VPGADAALADKVCRKDGHLHRRPGVRCYHAFFIVTHGEAKKVRVCVVSELFLIDLKHMIRLKRLFNDEEKKDQ
jgi:hypothetical protein